MVTAPRESLALGGRALALVRGLPDHSVIDRLVRGRAWIPVLGVLLAGIVAMQVEILKLGASTGRAVEQTATLQTQNESLQARAATLADDQRIERVAAAEGMVMPSPDSLVFISAHPGGQVGRALSNIHAPDPSGFTSELAAQAAAAAALMPAAPASTSTASGTSTDQTPATSATTPTIPGTTPASTAPTTAPATSGQPTAPSAPAAGSSTAPGPTTSAGSGSTTTSAGAAGLAPAAPSGSTGG